MSIKGFQIDINLGEISDVTLTGSPAGFNGGALVYNGTNWVNSIGGTVINVANKAEVVSLIPEADKILYIRSDDGKGNMWRAVTGAAPLTYSDNGGSFCGTTIIPTGGDGSKAWVRDYNGFADAKWWGAVGDGAGDNYTELAAFFASILLDDIERIRIVGTFNTSAGLALDGGGALRNVEGDFTLQATDAMDTVLKIDNCKHVYFTGDIKIFGTGSYDFASRTCRIGLEINDSERAQFERIRTQYFYQYGVSCSNTGNNNLASLGNIRCYDCGTYTNTGDRAAVFAWSNPVNSGSSGSTSQRTIIEVDNIPNGINDAEHETLEIDGELYLITQIDDISSPKTLTIYPWVLSTSGSSGNGAYIVGAGVNIDGSDSGILKIDGIDASRCGRGLWSRALYGSVVDRLVTQFTFIALNLGDRSGAAHVTDTIGGFYCENNLYDIVKNAATVDMGVNILGTYALNFDKCIAIAPNSSTDVTMPNLSHFNGVNINNYGQHHKYIQNGRNSISGTQSISFNTSEELYYLGTTGTATYAIGEPDLSLNRLYGYSGISWTIIEDTGGTLGAITINAPTGWTIMGGASYLYTPTAGVSGVRISVFALFADTDLRVSIFEGAN